MVDDRVSVGGDRRNVVADLPVMKRRCNDTASAAMIGSVTDHQRRGTIDRDQNLNCFLSADCIGIGEDELVRLRSTQVRVPPSPDPGVDNRAAVTIQRQQ